MKRVAALLAVLLLAVLIAAGGYLYTSPVQARALYTGMGLSEAWVELVAGWLGVVEPDAGPPAIIVSGTIEADEVAIVAELSGRVVELFAAEGDEVPAGALLLQLDETDVLATLEQAGAAVEVARANLAATKAGPRGWEVEAAEAAVGQAATRLEGTRVALRNAEALSGDPQELAAQIDAARSQGQVLLPKVEQARAAVRMAEIVRDSGNLFGSDREKTEFAAYNKHLEAAQERLAAAQAAHRGAQHSLAALQAIAEEPLVLEAQVHSAESQVSVAEASLEVARAGKAVLLAGPRPAAVAVAEAQLRQAQAASALLRVQQDKLALYSPIAGLVTGRVIEVGETALPARPLMTVADLSQVELVVYVPTDQIGRVRLGQQAQITVAAYGERIFAGRVSFIASEVEFTPRSAHTKEERARTVFAVKITLPNLDLALKPGMPAEVELLDDAGS